MERPVKAMVCLVDGMVLGRVGCRAGARQAGMELVTAAVEAPAGGGRAALGMTRRAGTVWIGCPPH
jgi:hypothetical protein